jgi:kinase-associated protein B
MKPPRALIKILAVLKHPTQGDLHNPFQVDVPLFHQRRALADQEKAWVPLESIQLFNDSPPEYQVSLRQALEQEMKALTEQVNENTEKWVKRSLEELELLKKEYFSKG